MAGKNIIFVLTVSLSVVCIRSDGEATRQRHDKVVVCRFAPNSASRNVDEEVSLCTHIIFEKAWIDTTKYSIAVDENMPKYKSFILAIKKTDPEKKVTMTVEIDCEPSAISVPPNRTTRNQLIQSAVDHVRDYGLDGLDLFFLNYPETSEDADKLQFLVQDLKETFIFSNHIVTATFEGRNKLVTFTKELVKLSRYLDLIHVPTSNVDTTPRGIERSFSPLTSKNPSDDRSVDFLIKHLVEDGVKPVKLVLLFDLRAYFYFMSDPEAKKIRLEDLVVINSKGSEDYLEICHNATLAAIWTYKWDDDISASYIRKKNIVAFTENLRSVVDKVKMSVIHGIKGFALPSNAYAFATCVPPNDTYNEFIKRYVAIKDDPYLIDQSNKLNLPIADEASYKAGKLYAVANYRLYFRVPQVQPGPNRLLREIYQAIDLSIEEKKIEDALELEKWKPKEIYCDINLGCSSLLLDNNPNPSFA